MTIKNLNYTDTIRYLPSWICNFMVKYYFTIFININLEYSIWSNQRIFFAMNQIEKPWPTWFIFILLTVKTIYLLIGTLLHYYAKTAKCP